MKLFACLTLVLPVLGACSADQPLIHSSPSGDYGIYGAVHGPSGAIVTLHLVDASGEEISAMFTGASDAMKWAVGWMPEEDIVVLWSSDIGTSAYAVDSNGLLRLDEISDDIQARARELYESKYGVR